MMNKIKLILAVLVTTFCLSLFSVVFAQQKEGFFIGWSQPLLGGGDLEVNTKYETFITNTFIHEDVSAPNGYFFYIPEGTTDTLSKGFILDSTTTVSSDTDFKKPEVDFKSGYGIKAGWNFTNFRIYYLNSNLAYKDTEEFKDVKIISNIIFADLVYKGFFIGVGVGKANIDGEAIVVARNLQFNVQISEPGDVTTVNLGYDYNITENFKISVGYLKARLKFEFDQTISTSRIDSIPLPTNSNDFVPINVETVISIPTNYKIKAGGDALYVDAVYTF